MPEVPGLAVDEVPAARKALAQAASQATATLRSASHPEGKAIGNWTETDLAIHMSHVIDAIAGVAKGTGSLVDNVWDIEKLTSLLMAGESERKLPALAARIDATVADLIKLSESTSPNEHRDWVVKGVSVPMSLVLCQALNELVIHGQDLALAEGQERKVERSEATLILKGFLFPILDMLDRAMVDQTAGKGFEGTFEIRLRGKGGKAYFHFDDGSLTITDTKPGKVDCVLSVDPATFLLVAWGRGNQWKAIGKGQLMAWGRKPWLGLKLRALLRNP